MNTFDYIIDEIKKIKLELENLSFGEDSSAQIQELKNRTSVIEESVTGLIASSENNKKGISDNKNLIDELTLAQGNLQNGLNIHTSDISGIIEAIKGVKTDIQTQSNTLAENVKKVDINSKDILANKGNISTNKDNIAANLLKIDGNLAKIEENASKIKVNSQDIVQMKTNISSNTENIDLNARHIEANSNNISNAASLISVNTDNITKNTEALSNLSTQVDKNKNAITQHKLSIDNVVSQANTNKDNIALLTPVVNDNKSKVATFSSAIESVNSLLDTVNTNTNNLTKDVETINGTLTSHGTRLDSIEGNVSTNATGISSIKGDMSSYKTEVNGKISSFSLENTNFKNDINSQISTMNNNIESKISVLQSATVNSNFLINERFKINQRGQTSYNINNAPANKYTVDRLMFCAGTAYTLTPIDGGGITIQNEGNLELKFKQRVEDGIKKFNNSNGTFTMSINGNIYSLTMNCSPGTSQTKYFDGGRMLIEISSSTFDCLFYIEGKRTLTIDWWKLEKGSTFTPFVPRLEALEEMLCQRYYLETNIVGASGLAESSSTFYITLPLLAPFRSKPTLSLPDGPLAYGGGGASKKNSKTTQVYKIFTNSIVLAMRCQGLIANDVYVVVDRMRKIVLDAEMY